MSRALPAPGRTTRYMIPADVGLVSSVRTNFSTDLNAAQLSEAERQAWLLSFNELVFNAIIHGAGSDPDKEVRIEWNMTESAVFLATEDPGPGPEEHRLSHPSLPEDPLAESGRGIFMLADFADQMRYFRGPKGFRLEIEKKHPGIGRQLDLDPEMERTLEELSTCYESLSIFYRLAQNLQESAELGKFIGGALDDFIRLHPFQTVFLLGSDRMPESVFQSLKEEAWFLDPKLADHTLTTLCDLQQEVTWDHVSDLRHVGIESHSNRLNPGCALPVTAGDLHFGCLVALRTSSQDSLHSRSLGILRTLSDLCGIACVNTHLRQIRDQSQKELGELAAAVEIQKALLPILPSPTSDKWNVGIFHQPSLKVAGDYAIARRDHAGNLVTAIIDVMGKGVSAALLSSIFRSTFELCVDTQTSAKLLEIINRHLCNQLGNLTMFITCAIIRLDRDGKTMDFASAGHCKTIVQPSDAESYLLEASGPPLGIMDDSSYTSELIHLEGGERIVMLTDGCYEWDRAQDTLAGWQNFFEHCEKFRKQEPSVIWDELMTRIAGGNPITLEDDCTLLTIDIPS
jgi:serine phosphatase RsbU (regulator of sigma subunit)/anti-sigma regulatory factor (Ser/Thr protein kinase)